VSRWGRRRVALAVAACAAAVALGLALAGAARGIALYAYVLVLAGVGVAMLASRLRSAWPATPRFERLLPAVDPPESRILQLEGLTGRLAGGYPNEGEVHARLRPLVQDVAAARLAGRHGVDLESMPARARALVGPRTWELVRPDREPPADRFARAWSPRDLHALVDELERI
jgi:hypothetical protein